jgi:hypothetical protein
MIESDDTGYVSQTIREAYVTETSCTFVLCGFMTPRLNRYQLCAKYGWAFSSDMPDRHIKRKGIIFDEIAEKGDLDQTTHLQRGNRQLREEMERIGQDYQKVKKVLEVIMPVIDSLQAEQLKEKILGVRKQQLARASPLENHQGL